MKLTDAQEETIDRWLSAVETGTPNGNYSKVTILNDNPVGGPQITYGKHQTTEAGGNLCLLLKNYLARNSPSLGMADRAFVNSFLKAPRYSFANHPDFLLLLRKLGNDPIMRDVQNEFFLEHYMKPARAWAEANGFTLPLSMLVIYDSFIQSGSIRDDLRRRFRAVPPAQGGDEKKWISSYVDARHQWLKYWGNGRTDKSRVIRKSSYRTEALNAETDRNNWDLSIVPMYVNGINISKPA